MTGTRDAVGTTYNVDDRAARSVVVRTVCDNRPVTLRFEWDGRKAASNLKKHGVSFEEAATAFADPLSLTVADPDHSGHEDRFILLGLSFRGRLVVVAHSDHRGAVRIISRARRPPVRE